MILSVSRRTDIPTYYSDWFYNRIKEGFLYVRNPMNPHQVSKITISPELVDCIVFWTKNPEPMLARLEELKDYQYYFQFTLTGYGRDIERNIPHKKEKMIPVFQQLSKCIGPERVIWRYDPILFTERYTAEYHLKAFEQIATALNGYTKKCVISFVDLYTKNRKALKELGMQPLEMNTSGIQLSGAPLKAFAGKLAAICHANHMEIATCAENIDLSECGIVHNSCIDRELIERLTGCKLKIAKDKNQRPECGCVESIEVGTYDTCLNGCVYCYANSRPEAVLKNVKAYDMNSPILCGTITEDYKVTERKVASLKESQK